MKRAAAVFTVLALSISGLAACGGEEGGGDPLAGPAQLAPADSVVYAETTLRPDPQRASAIDSLGSKLAGEEDLGALIIGELERSAASEDFDLDYERDIDPWLGEQAGVFVPRPSEDAGTGSDQPAAVVIESTDATAAEEFVGRVAESDPSASEKDADGNPYFFSADDNTGLAVSGDFVVVGEEAAVVSALGQDAGSSLAADEGYKDAISGLPEERLAHFYLDTEGLIELGAEGNEQELEIARNVFGDALSEPLAGSVDVADDRIIVDYSGPATAYASGGEGLLGSVPGDAFFATGIADLGGTLRSLLEQLRESDVEGLDINQAIEDGETQLGLDIEEDLLSWMGDAAIFATGESEAELGVGILVETTDPETSKQTLDTFATLVGFGGGGPAPAGADAGFTFSQPGQGSASVAQRGDQIQIAIAPGGGDLSAIEEAFSSGGGEVEGADLLADGFVPVGFVDFGGIVALADNEVDPADPEYPAVREVLVALDRLVFGIDPEDRGSGEAVISVDG